MQSSSPIPSQTCSEPLVLIMSFLVTFVTHFPMILLITSPAQISVTYQLPLLSGINRLAKVGSAKGSTSSVHSHLARVAKESQRFVQASVLLNPFTSRSEGPQEHLVLKICSRIISPFICWYSRMAGTSSPGPNNIEPKLACCAFGCLSASCSMTCSDNTNTPP